jgi:hypothetical protein
MKPNDDDTFSPLHVEEAASETTPDDTPAKNAEQ